MQGARHKIPKLGVDALFTRCGYTGEDGFEVAINSSKAVAFCEMLRAEGVEPCGLGARDSLRLEAGLCLYGHEMNEKVSPVEAALQWVITPRRRTEGGFIGHEKYMEIRKKGVPNKRVGFIYTGNGSAAREQTDIVKDGKKVGHVTSGSFGPTVGKNLGMAYIDNGFNEVGTKLHTVVRGKEF